MNKLNDKVKTGIPVILCVGSDKIAGDSVGPIVGTLLKDYFKLRCYIYGQKGKSVNGKNLNQYLNHVKIAHPDSPIIAVDACICDGALAGNVYVVQGGINPARSVTGKNNPVGDVGILGAVEGSADNPLSSLLAVKWVNVERLCYKIAFSLYCAFSD